MFNSPDYLIHTFTVGTLAYIAIIFLLRVSGKRTLSKWNSFDFIVTIAFGSILASLLLSTNTSLAQGILGFGLLILLQYIITWLSVRSNIIQKLVKAKPSLLLYQGKILHHILKQERVAEGEVLAALRSNGITAIEDAQAVILETDGSFSVIQQLGNGYASALKDVKGYPKN
ncbi:DUF421 domain-containing protein [Mastigocoleus testarum]|uniref:DUF421 domain-containing protein n=1 Tax=Mastigocoleus testarum BC008 TaxID=371196 RepID=A0A0V7ZZK7_9CYAN|nr:YetF domain-containing protein [Mastigocoleus testarum]KST70003.1 hypothetical protein BC008_06080 [Mastigocoleus testarum BC008]